MRRNRIVVLGAVSIAVGLTSSLIAAGTFSLDLSDFNDDVMRDMDDTMKRLDSDIATRDVKSVVADSVSLREGLKYAQDYFTKKGNLDDAIRWAKQGQDLTEAIGGAAQASDLELSLSKYDALVKTCRSCHDVYKPPDI
jgi:hypothetical protein